MYVARYAWEMGGALVFVVAAITSARSTRLGQSLGPPGVYLPIPPSSRQCTDSFQELKCTFITAVVRSVFEAAAVR